MELICINCPMGCLIDVQKENDELIITGNNCKAGENYARNEISAPKRTITSTCYINSGKRVSCKTNKPIDKKIMLDVMKEIHKLKLDPPIRINDVLIKNVLNTDVDIVATKNID